MSTVNLASREVSCGAWNGDVCMARILVLGCGVIGLSTALMLRERGHEVLVLERDSEPVPDSVDQAWLAWGRKGVGQFRQGHYLHPAAIRLIETNLPGANDALIRAGVHRFDALATLPETVADRTRRHNDQRFVTLAGRRSTIEYALARHAEQTLPVRRGVLVRSLVTGPSTATGIPHITGVRTLDGEEILADLLVDATGRASKLPQWLEAIGARRIVEESEESGFIYYTRFFRSRDGAIPTFRGWVATEFDSFSLLTLPADAGIWSVTVVISSGDQMLKKLRDPLLWTRLVASCPLHSHWLNGESITEVLPMGGVADRYRRFVVEGNPVATGIVSVGDSMACTNPSLGRGIAMGLMQAAGTVDVAEKHLDDPRALALAHDVMTEQRIGAWYRNAVAVDRKRTAQCNAVIAGKPEPKHSGASAKLFEELTNAMMYDADLYRAWLEMASMYALPQQVLVQPWVIQRIKEVSAVHQTVAIPSPSRNQLSRWLDE